MTAAVKGYPLIIAVPEKMGRGERVGMKVLGAEIIRTQAAAHDDPESLLGVQKPSMKRWLIP